MTSSPIELAGKYLKEGRVMQLATHHGEDVRVNSLYYVSSDDMKSVYWLSEPRRRHSQDILTNPRVGGAIAIKTDMPVIGLQFIGDASEVTDMDEIKNVVDAYNEKYEDSVEGLYERFVAKKNKHHLYKVAIREMEIFDEVNFPDGEVMIVNQ